MEKQELENYLKAGRIASSVKAGARKGIRPGQSLLEIAEKIEKEIIEEGARPAFPVNLSVNENAAHYTPKIKDALVLGEKDLLKVDIGVHCEGFIADCAFSIDFSGESQKLVEASEKALENALSIIKPGLEIGKIGAEIERTIKSFGFEPVYNLSGHGLAEFETHSFPTIPNHTNHDSKVLEDGMAFAIEPFATNGQGHVSEGNDVEIFALKSPQNCRNATARSIVEFALEEYKTLPFAERWIQAALKPSEFERRVALKELMQRGILHQYPVLHEQKEKLVSQAETSIIISDGEVRILVE